MAIACYRCGKAIKGKLVRHVPSTLMVRLGIDFPRSYHPACYAKAEKEAASELWPNGLPKNPCGTL